MARAESSREGSAVPCTEGDPPALPLKEASGHVSHRCGFGEGWDAELIVKGGRPVTLRGGVGGPRYPPLCLEMRHSAERLAIWRGVAAR